MQPPDERGPGTNAIPDAEALGRALRFVDYRPRSAGETTSRLRRWGYDARTCQEVTAYLEEAGIIDDREFARLFMGELIRKGLGRYRVRSELIKKKLERELVEEVMEGYPEDEEVERAADAAVRRYSQMGPRDAAADKKVMDHLRRKGFSRQVAGAACRMAAQVDTQSGPELE